MKKAYLDTNILIAYIAGPEKDRQFPMAKDIFEKIKNSDFLGIISTLTLMEVLQVFRRQLGSDRTTLQTIPRYQQPDHIKNESHSMYQGLLKELLKLPNIKFEKGSYANIATLFETSFEILQEIKGTVKFYNSCGFCGSNSRISVHKAVATMDITHAVIAKNTGCELLLTFDKGFKELIDNAKLVPLEIQVKEF